MDITNACCLAVVLINAIIRIWVAEILIENSIASFTVFILDSRILFSFFSYHLSVSRAEKHY